MPPLTLPQGVGQQTPYNRAYAAQGTTMKNDWRLVYVKAVYAYVSYWGKYSSRNKHAARKAAQFTAYTLSESEVHEWASAIRRGHAMGYKPFDGPHGSHYSFYIAA